MTTVHGIDSLGNQYPLLVDASGQVIVSRGQRVLIDPGGADKVFSYELPVGNTKFNTSLPAGTSVVLGDPVPAGKVWVITFISCAYVGTVAGAILQTIAHLPTTDYVIISMNPPVSGLNYDRTGMFVLAEAGYIFGKVYGATLNDDLYFTYGGYQMDAT